MKINLNFLGLFNRKELTEKQTQETKSKDELIEMLYGIIEPAPKEDDGPTAHLLYGIIEPPPNQLEPQDPQEKLKNLLDEMQRNMMQTMQDMNAKFQDFFSNLFK